MKKGIRGALLLAILGVTTVLMVSAPSSASATPVVVNGDRTELVVPFTLLQALNGADMTIEIISPGVINFQNWPIPVAQFPITGGLVDDGTLIGTVNHAGGQRFVQYDPPRENVIKTLEVTNFRIVNGNMFFGDTMGLIPGPAADLVNPTHTVDPQTGEIILKAEARMNSGAALILNTYFNTNVFQSGMLLGNLTSYINSPPGYPRPKAATPLSTPLVPAYQEACFFPNRTHGGPLSYSGCSPTEQASGFLTTGTPDANGQPAQFVGNVKMVAVMGDPGTPADDADVNVTVNVTDVRNKGSLSDYEGQLLLRVPLRITDMTNHNGPTEPPDKGTSTTTGLSFVVPCAATPEDIGGACNLTTTADSVAPGAVQEGNRAIWQTDQLQVYDGGSDGSVATADDDTLFATQGIFVP